jgi:hypothetical protein
VEHHASPIAPREWVVLNAQGEVLASTTRAGPGAPLSFDLRLPDGQPLQLQVQSRLAKGHTPKALGHVTSARRCPGGPSPPDFSGFWV